MFRKSFPFDATESKSLQMGYSNGVCHRSLIKRSVLNNDQMLNTFNSQNNSLCSSEENASQGTCARQTVLISPSGNSALSNECSSCPPRRESEMSERVCCR